MSGGDLNAAGVLDVSGFWGWRGWRGFWVYVNGLLDGAGMCLAMPEPGLGVALRIAWHSWVRHPWVRGWVWGAEDPVRLFSNLVRQLV